MNEENENKDKALNEESQQTTGHAPEVETVKKDEVDWKSKYYYLAAEMENSKKRFEREREGLLKYGTDKVLGDLLDVVDNFERTVEMLRFDQEDKIKNIVTGLEMVRRMFLESMGKHGLTQIESLGKDFDPNFHEAMGQEYAEGKRPNEILKEYQKGYVLNGRLLRAAKVVVANDKQ